MAFKYILACVVILCPYVSQAGRVQGAGAAMPGGAPQDYDYEGPGAGPGHKELGDLGDGKPVQMGIKEIFQIPDNTSEDEWHKAQLENFQKQQYNDFQKQEYEKWEKHRFFQYQQQLLAEKAKNHNEQLQGLHSNFIQAAEHEMRGAQDPAHKHHIMQQFHQKKAAQERYLHEEHQRFLHEEKNKMQAEQQHHHGWLQNMLMNQEGGRTMLRNNPSGRQHEL